MLLIRAVSAKPGAVKSIGVVRSTASFPPPSVGTPAMFPGVGGGMSPAGLSSVHVSPPSRLRASMCSSGRFLSIGCPPAAVPPLMCPQLKPTRISLPHAHTPWFAGHPPYRPGCRASTRCFAGVDNAIVGAGAAGGCAGAGVCAASAAAAIEAAATTITREN
jgi:hypothetical protein